MNMSQIAASFQDVDWNDISSWPVILKLFISLLIGIGILVGIYMVFYKPKMEEVEAARIREQNIVAALRTVCGTLQQVGITRRCQDVQIEQVETRFDGYLLGQRRATRSVPVSLVF